MEAKLENFIEKIKSEGVEEAKKQSDEIITKSRQDASEIIKSAKTDAEKIIKDAENQADKFKQNAENAINQAARDSVLKLKEKITALFDNVFKKQISSSMNVDFLKVIIEKIASNWGRENNLEVLVNQDDTKKLQELVLSSIKDELKNSITIKTDSRIHKGFRIGLKGEEVYYDLTDEGILEFLKQFLNPVLAEILK